MSLRRALRHRPDAVLSHPLGQPLMQPLDIVHDAARLAALDSYDILDTEAEPGFDGIVRLASTICDTPVALVSLIASDRQWFKARVGFEPCETEMGSSVCAHALVEPDLLIIPDLTKDPRSAQNPLVTGEPYIRFYDRFWRKPAEHSGLAARLRVLLGVQHVALNEELDRVLPRLVVVAAQVDALYEHLLSGLHVGHVDVHVQD